MKLGRTYLVLGEPDRALKALEPIQPVYPDLPWPHVIAGAAKMAKGEPAAAIVELRAALATNPFDPEVHCTLADAYERAEREMDVTAALQALALVVLALRVKKIKIKSNSITFYHTPKLESLIVELIRRLLHPGDE